jgi:hypothetical protein
MRQDTPELERAQSLRASGEGTQRGQGEPLTQAAPSDLLRLTLCRPR